MDYNMEAGRLASEAKRFLATDDRLLTSAEVERGRKLLQRITDLKTKAEIMRVGGEIYAESEKREKERDMDHKFGKLLPTGGSEHKDFAQFLGAVGAAGRYGANDKRLRVYDEKTGESKALSEGAGASGGFLVPTEYRTEILQAVYDNAQLWGRCSGGNMKAREIKIPALDQTSTETGVDNWHGGITLYWTEEAAEKTEADPEFRMLDLVAHKLTGYIRASDELMSDGASFASWLKSDKGFVGAFAWVLDRMVVRGTGTGQPLGIMNAGATITCARDGDTDIRLGDLWDMRMSLIPGAKRPVWIAGLDTMKTIAMMCGPSGNAEYVFSPFNSLNLPKEMLGIPVIWSEHASNLGTAGDLILADLSFYRTGDRQAVTVESTQAERFKYDQTSFRATWRGAGRPQLSTYITAANGSQVSPFVMLGDKSS